jgi:hypothetical protein
LLLGRSGDALNKVGEGTIKRAGKFAEAVDALAGTLGDEARTAILSGDSKVTKQDVVDAAWYEDKSGIAEVLAPDTHSCYEPPHLFQPVKDVLQAFVLLPSLHLLG